MNKLESQARLSSTDKKQIFPYTPFLPRLMKLSIAIGTRPEAIKLAPVVLALRAHGSFDCHVCAVGQHREMLDEALRTFGIVPDVELRLMQPGQTLTELTCRGIETLGRYLAAQQPDMVLVQGDTTTVLSCALAALYHGVSVGHIEAGLRTWNMRSPWPEEANRVVTSHLAALHFAPTERSRDNLIAEGISEKIIFVTGNTVIDALFLAVAKVRRERPCIPGIEPRLMDCERAGPVVLITGHRRESFGKKLETICEAIRELAKRFPNTEFIYPVHLNPVVRRTVGQVLGRQNSNRSFLKNVHLIEPLSYFHFVALMERAALILTDSGGIQEEAPSLGKPVLVTRDTTERPEAVAAGSAKLVGCDPQEIIQEVTRLLMERRYYEKMVAVQNPYGDGKAAGRIVDAISRYFGLSSPPDKQRLRSASIPVGLPVSIGSFSPASPA